MTDADKVARLERALLWGGPTHTLADITELARAGRAQIWENRDGVVITEVNEFPLLKTVHYWLISGHLPDCLALDAPISKWAVEQGCEVATATGRRGWGRVAEGLGWRPHAYTFVKPLTREVWHVGR